MGNRIYQLTSAGRSAHGWQISRHWLAGNSHFRCGRIFIFRFSEPLGINIEGFKSLLLGIQHFIQICFDGLCCGCLKLSLLIKTYFCILAKQPAFKSGKFRWKHFVYVMCTI